MRDILFSVGNWVALLVSVGLVVIWIVYGLLFRWKRTRAGTAFYVFVTSLVALITLNTVTLWLGKEWLVEVFGEETVFREVVRIAVYAYCGVGLGWLVYGLVYNWRRAGIVLDLERRAVKARAELDGKPVPRTEEIDIQ